MFRRFALVVLTLGAISTADAQGTEVIIRRSGQKDQVIKIDEKQARELTAKVTDQLKGAMLELKSAEAAHADNLFRFTFDTMKLGSMSKELAGRVEELATRNAETSARVGAMARSSAGAMARVIRESMMQPRIGIFVDNTGSQASDKYGALVSSVSPGGPADKAGLRSGDIITKVDGKSLAASAKDEALPGVRLVEIISKLAVGKPVSLEYRRGTTTNTTKVTPVEEGEIAFSDLSPTIVMRSDSVRLRNGMQVMPRGATMATRVPLQLERPTLPGFEDAMPSVPGSSFSIAFSNGGPLSNLELVSLNEKLGTYFGTTEGVLVVNVGSKDAFGLTPGDVIVSVDGRKVNASSQLMRILRTYDKGEEFKIQILRQKKAETLTGKLP
jgi:hypothetical protein